MSIVVHHLFWCAANAALLPTKHRSGQTPYVGAGGSLSPPQKAQHVGVRKPHHFGKTSTTHDATTGEVKALNIVRAQSTLAGGLTRQSSKPGG